jgi:aquaporin Z
MAVQATLTAKLLSEFVGTGLLVLTIGSNVLSGNAVWGGASIGCVLMVSIYALGGISGAHFNPAVSFAFGLIGALEWKMVAYYSLAQVTGGLVAALTYEFLFWNSFNLEPAKYANYVDVGLCEVLYTFMLVFVVLNVAVSHNLKGKNSFYGLAIGSVIIAGAYGAGPISGGCFNPAVAIGIDTASVLKGFGWCLAYTFYELSGAGIAVVVFMLVRPEDFGKSKTMLADLVSEFAGTYMLLVTVGLNILAGSPSGAFSIAAALTCMIYALGDVSGAHFNPAVTFTILIAKMDARLTWRKAFYYVVVQLIAGIVGAWTFMFLALRQFEKTGKGDLFHALSPSKDDWVKILFAEVMFTFLLCYIVLSVACSRSSNKTMFGLAIGTCVTVGGNAIGSISGGSLNPAVSAGLNVACEMAGNPCRFLGVLLYILFELVGGFLAALSFAATHGPTEQEEGKIEDDEMVVSN